MTDLAPSPPSAQAPALAALLGIRHGFFGRQGGVSQGIYASLNCGPGSADAGETVRANRARIARALDVEPQTLLTVFQVHSPRCVPVEGPWSEAGPPEADAMVTRTPGLALGVLAADCVPVLFADAEAGVIGAAHAGWKGALGGVLEATLAAMQRAGAEPSRIIAAIGPSIGAAAYEVGVEFEARFVEADAANIRFFTPGRPGHAQFDLPAYVRARLESHAVARIDTIGHCTYENEERYFSYRRATHRGEPDYGRNLSVIALAGGA